ncbi:MAG: S8 family serine peptidase [Candidatus Aenigmarchaeota archaeon]|nr:S8 family serine peptidase [Candidatus Aenigmarchaeota archaeon]
MGTKQVAAILLAVSVLGLAVAMAPALGEDSFHSVEFESKVHDDVKEEVAADPNDTIEVIVETSGGDESAQREAIELIGNITHDYSTIDSFSVEIRPEDLDELSQEDFVTSIEPDPIFIAQLQTSVPLVNASVTWSRTVSGVNLTGRGIGVCIIDTGVNYTHPDLGGCPATSDINTAGCSRVVAGYDFVNDDNNPMDDVDHGTHVAGIVGANGGIVGVAPNSSIIAIKSLAPGNPPSGTLSDIVAGIDWCVSNATSLNISVISMSLGDGGTYAGYCDGTYPSMTAAINSAISSNITVVVASGNDGSTSGMSNPACVTNATSIGSTTDSDVFSSFSNRNSILDLAAPGSTINSTRIQGGYVEFSGTSMATPHAAGMFAILYQKYKLLYNAKPAVGLLESISKSSGVMIYDSGVGMSFPRIDVLNTSQQIRSTYSSHVSGNSTIERGSQVNFSAMWSSNVNLGFAVLSTNETGAFLNKTENYGSPQTLFAMNWSNFTWSNSSVPNGTVVLWRIYANDSAGNQNATDALNFTVLDTTIYMTNSTKTNDTSYSSGAFYSFNVTVTEFTGTGNVTFEWDSSQNSTVYLYQTLNSSSSVFMANKTDLPAGNYTYRWIANDTLGNRNSASGTFNLSKAQPAMILSSTPSNSTVFGGFTAANGTIVTGDVSFILSLTRNGTVVNTSSSRSVTENVTLGSGTHNYTLTYNGTQNYTSFSISNLTSVSTAPTSIGLFLNGTQGNFTYDRSSQVNITARVNVTGAGLNVSIFLNSSGTSIEVNSSSNTASYFIGTSGLNLGIYNVTASYNGSSSNYSRSSQTFFFSVREFYRNFSVSIQNGTLELVDADEANTTLDFLTNDTVINNETNVSVGSDNPVGANPSGISIGKFLRINVSSRIASNLTYAVIRFSYLDSDVPSGADESTLRLFRWNGSSWVRFDGQFIGGVDTSSNVVFANTTQFSDFTVAGEAASSPAPVSVSSSGGGGGAPLKKSNVSVEKENNTTEIPVVSEENVPDVVLVENTTAAEESPDSSGDAAEPQTAYLSYATTALAVIGVAAVLFSIRRKISRLLEFHRRPWRQRGSGLHFHKNSRRRRPS